VLFSIQCFIRCSAIVWFNSFVQCSNYSVYVLSWSWKCIPNISIPLNINHQAVNKNHTADSTIFCLSRYKSKRPFTIIDIEGYPEPNFSIQVKQTARQLECYCIKYVFDFQTLLTVLFNELFLKMGLLTSSFKSQEFITVGIFEIYFTTTEIW
jgi:hypothetical protein